MSSGQRLRIVFAGTPEFSVSPLQGLIRAGFAPKAVLTQPDRRSGRGRRLQAGPVKQAAQQAGIPVHQPGNLKNPQVHGLITDLEPDLMVVVAYGLILPPSILDIPRNGCWNIHASLLPRWRGAAPIQRAIEAGDRNSGVCIMQMDKGLDTGPVIKRAVIEVSEQETGGSLHDKLALLGTSTLLDCVRQLAEGSLPAPMAQPPVGVTYARKLEKNEARIDWSRPATELERRIRAFDPWPVCWCLIGDERTRVWRAAVIRDANGERPGTVLSVSKAGIDIATGHEVLRLLELQRPGKKRMEASDYINAVTLPDVLEDGS